jgi:formylglycine-generating enzyme required for sulfatase activity
MRIAAADALGSRDPRLSIAGKFRNHLNSVARSGQRGTKMIGRHLVTNCEFGRFIRAGGYRNEAYWGRTWSWVIDRGLKAPAFWDNPRLNRPNYPVVGVSFFEALAYCTWLSEFLRKERGELWRVSLPSDLDWDLAMHGARGALLQEIRLRLNRWSLEELDQTDMGEIEEDLTAFLLAVEPLVDGSRPLDQIPDHLPVGVLSPNENGFYDSFSGIWEWCSAFIDGRPVRSKTLDAFSTATPLITKGGPSNGRSLVWRLMGGWFDYETRYERLGFRICATTIKGKSRK